MRLRFFWIVVAVVGLLIIIAVLFLAINRPKETTTGTQTSKKVTLADYSSSNAVVSYAVEGITNSNELHRIIKITVSRDTRKLEIFEGYQGRVLKSSYLGNNSDAYKAFLAGLQNKGFLTESKKDKDADILGQCPLGNKYIFRSSGIENVANYLWTTSCAVSPGTFGGNRASVQKLFQLQIPNYSKLVSGVSLN